MRKATGKLPALVALLVLCLGGLKPAAGDDGLMTLSVIFTNDMHGGIDRTGATFMNREFPPPLGGGASAAAYIGKLRERAAAEGNHVLVVDQGDIFQGTPVGNYRQGEAMIEYFNHVGLDLWTVRQSGHPIRELYAPNGIAQPVVRAVPFDKGRLFAARVPRLFEHWPQAHSLHVVRDRLAHQVEQCRHDVDLAHRAGHPLAVCLRGQPDQQRYSNGFLEHHTLGQ